MKRTTLGRLMWRELFLARKQLVWGVLLFIVTLAICVMVSLSMDYGNLALLTAEDLAVGKEEIELIAFFLPTGLIFGLMMAVAEAVAKKDESARWQLFRHTVPVKPSEFAAAGYLLQALLLVGSIALAAIYLLLFCKLVHRSMTIQMLQAVFVIETVILTYSVCMRLLTMLLHSMDKAGFALVAVFLPLYCYFVLTIEPENQIAPNNILDYAVDKLAGVFPAAVAVSVVVFLGGFFITTLLLQRREK